VGLSQAGFKRALPAAAFQTLLGLGTARKSTEYQSASEVLPISSRKLDHNLLCLAESTG
jgi:hypothetical protein